MIKKIILIIIGVILLIGGFFVLRTKQQHTERPSATVKRGTFTVPLTLSGEIKASERYTARFQTTGLVTGVYVNEGDAVKKNQRLASLDQRKLKNDLEQLLNAYMNARWTFDQTKDDQQTTADTAPQQAVRERAKRLIDQAQFSLNRSVLAVEAQALALEFSVLKSPIDGIVVKAPQITSGMNIVNPAQAEFEIINPNSLYFEAIADQTEVTQIGEQMEATITLDAYPDESIAGVVAQISFVPKEGQVGTAYAVSIDLPQETRSRYRLGMTGDAQFIAKSKENALFLPISFVTSKNGKKYVTIKEGNRFKEIEVTTGLENDEDIEILSGVSEGTVVYD